MGQADKREIKRTWHYANHPWMFEAKCTNCGEHKNITWSEWQQHLWCFECEEDVRVEGSLLNGPIAPIVAEAMGINFDIIIIATGELKKYNSKTGEHESTKS